MLKLSKALYFQCQTMNMFRIFSIFLYLHQSIYCYSGIETPLTSGLLENLSSLSNLTEIEKLLDMENYSLPEIPLEDLSFLERTTSITNAAFSFNETIRLVIQAHKVLYHPLYPYPSAIKRSTEITTNTLTSTPNECQSCRKKFTTTFQLRKHEKLHDEREYSCEICKKLIEKYSSLLTHLLRNHEGIFQVKCLLHDDVFSNSKTLQDNIKKHHKTEQNVKDNFTFQRLNQSGLTLPQIKFSTPEAYHPQDPYESAQLNELILSPHRYKS